MLAARKRAEALARMRALAQAGAAPEAPASPRTAAEYCDLCHTRVPDDHRHLLHLQERRIVCAISFGYEDAEHPANAFRTSRAEPDEVVTWWER